MRAMHEMESVSGGAVIRKSNALLHRCQTGAAQHHWVSNPGLHFPSVYDNALRGAFRAQERWETHAATLGNSNELIFKR